MWRTQCACSTQMKFGNLGIHRIPITRTSKNLKNLLRRKNAVAPPYIWMLFFVFSLTIPATCRFRTEMFLACEYRSRRAVLRQTLLDQCVSKGVGGWLLPTLSQPCGWILFGCGCGCEVLQLQPHVCAGKMTCLKLLVVAPPWPGSSSVNGLVR